MPTSIVVILVVTALVSLGALVLLAVHVVRTAARLGGDVVDLRDRLLPELERIQHDAAVTASELDQVGLSLGRLRRHRERRDETAHEAHEAHER